MPDFTRLVIWLYNVILTLSLPILYLRLLARSRKNIEYRNRLIERIGIFDAPLRKPCIWVHAVSVGEVVASKPLIIELQNEYKNHLIIISTTTPTGAEQVKKIFKDSVFHIYFPFDLPFCWNFFFKRIKPCLCLILETEIWPNLLIKIKQQQIPVMIVNGCLSQKSFQGYQKIKLLMKNILGNLDYIAAQTEKDAKRFMQLGVQKEKLDIVGNLKFDLQLCLNEHSWDEKLKSFKTNLEERFVWIAASTHKGEESLILRLQSILCQKFPNLLLILVPRHPERFDEVEGEIKKQNLKYCRHSSNVTPSIDTQVFLVDAMGELPLFYSLSNVAFVGGSFVNIGGHNILEPAFFGLPILVGPHTQNITETIELFQESSALIQVSNETELKQQIEILLKDKNKRIQMGLQAKQILSENRGACAKTVSIIKKFI